MRTGIKIVSSSAVAMVVGFVGCLFLVVANDPTDNIHTVTYHIPTPPPVDKRLSKMSFTQADMYDANDSNEYWYGEEEEEEVVIVEWNPGSEAVLKREIRCLAMNIYFEAGNQTDEGKLAVANVTLNRVFDPKYPNTLCGVVWQSKKRIGYNRVAQFSWTRDGLPDVVRKNEQELWEWCFQLARAIASEGTLAKMGNNMFGATHYHAHYVDPYWAPRLNKVATIGDHLFYRADDDLPVNKIPGAVASAN